MAETPLDDLKQVRKALVELRRREAAKIVDEGGALPTYAAGIFNTTNWIGAVDKAIEDEEKLGPDLAVAITSKTKRPSAKGRAKS